MDVRKQSSLETGAIFLLMPLLLMLYGAPCRAAQQEIIFPESKEVISEACIQPSGEAGICKLITDCPRVVQNIGIQHPKICGFRGRISIVCCNQDKDRVIDISPPTVDFECGNSLLGRRKRAISKATTPTPDYYDYFGPLPNFDYGGINYVLSGEPADIQEYIDPITGITSVIKAWPWMALLQRQNRAGDRTWFCGGILLNEKWVLTAAHCTNRFNVTLVRLGEHDFSTDDDGAQFEDVGVAEVIYHPHYQPPQEYHDIALIKLATSIKLRRDISPVCLPWGHETDLPLEGKTVTVTGWGTTRFFGDELSPFLNEIDVTVFPTDVCARSYSTLIDYNETYPQSLGEESLCIGDASDNDILKDSCPGDSGGPAVLLRDGRYTIVGVVSRGLGCGKKDFPGLYVNIQDPDHLSWIKKVAFLS